MTPLQCIREFVLKNFYVADPDELSDDASLLDLGIVDSTGVLEIVSFIEATFGIEVDDDEIVPKNLDSIRCIAKFVVAKGGEARMIA